MSWPKKKITASSVIAKCWYECAPKSSKGPVRTTCRASSEPVARLRQESAKAFAAAFVGAGHHNRRSQHNRRSLVQFLGKETDMITMSRRQPPYHDPRTRRQHARLGQGMTITKVALIAAATVGASIALPSTAHAGVPPSFQPPSGNILCWIADNAATCRVIDHTYALPPGGDCTSPGWGNSIFLDQGKPPFLTCDSTPPGTYNGLPAHTRLDYGQTQSAGVMTCDSEPSGMTCTDSSTSHFFRVSRESYQFG